MKLRDLRAQVPELRNYSDDEIAEAIAAVRGLDPRDPNVRRMIDDFKGYDRSTGEVIGDTVTQLGQGVVKIGSNLASGFGTWDNPVRRGLDSASDWLGEQFYSEGMQAQREGTAIYSNIRDQEATARGLTGPDRLAYDAQTALENYANAPGTLGADFFMNAPQLLVGGVAGRAGAAVGRGLGLGQRGAAVTGTAAAGGTAGFMQGSDIGAQTYDEALRAIMARNDAEAGLTADTIVVTPQGSRVQPGSARTDPRLATDAEREEATALANRAALQSGALTAATSMVPGSLERSMIPGLGTSTTRLGSVARVGGVETATNIVDEGFGQLASGRAVAEVDPNRDPWAGVGEAGVQGGAAGGPTGVVGGMVAPLRPKALPRTETGEIDATQPPGETYEDGQGDSVTLRYDTPPAMRQGQPRSTAGGPIPTDVDRPTWQRQGLDPLNERSSPWSPPQPQPTMADLITEPEPATFVDLVNRQAPRPLPPDPYTEWEQQAAQQPQPVAEPPLQLPYNPTVFTDPSGTSQVGQIPSEQEVAERKYPVLPADSDAADTERPPTKDEVRQIVEDAARELKQTYLKKDGTLTKTAEAIWAPILNAKDPAAKAREMHHDGVHPRDEFLDDIHRRLTGMSVIEWRERQNAPRSVTPQVNQAGFVTEPLEQVEAQVQAVKEGRKESVVVPPEQADQVDLTGLAKTTVTDPNTGESAVVASRNRATVQRAAARAQEVGLKQALGEAQNRVEPDATTQPTGNEVVVQQVDNETGQVLDDEVVSPENADAVQRVPGTTARVVPPEAVAERQRPTQSKPKKPRYGRKTVDELIEIADTTKSQEELDAAELELYKRWANQGDEAAETYFDGLDNRVRELQAMLDAEREAAATKRGQELGKKFNSVRARPTSEVQGRQPLAVKQVQDIVARVARLFPGAQGIQVARNPAEVGMEFPEGFVLAGGTRPDGSIVLFADGITDTMDALRTIFHELFHRGVAATPGYQQRLLDIAKRDPWIAAQARKWKLSQDGQRHRRRDDLTPEAYDALAVEESLARVSEQLQGGESVGSKRMAVRGLVKWLAAKADAWGMPELARWLRRATYTEAEKFVMEALAADTTTPPTSPRGGGGPVRARVVEESPDNAAAPEPPAYIQPLNRAARAAMSYIKAQATGKEISSSLLHAMTLRQIDEQYGKKLPAMRNWIESILERGAAGNKLASKADRVAKKWEQLDRRTRNALGEVLLRASVAGIHLDKTDAKYLESLDADQRREHTQLRQKLAALPQAAQDLRREVRSVLDEQWTTTRKALENFVEHTVTDPGLRAERIKQIRDEFGRSRGDYFPLSRFGDRIVIAKGAAKDGRDVISFHESVHSAEQERDHWRRQGVKHVVITHPTDRDFRQRASTGFMNQLHQMIDGSEVDPAVKDTMHEALQQLYLKSLPEVSGAKHMIRRENVEGYSKDALRSFADAVARGARYAANLQYAPDIQAALESAEVQSRSSDQRTASILIATKDGDPEVRVVPAGLDRLKAADELMSDGYTVSWRNVAPETAREYLASHLRDATDADLDNYVRQVEQAVGRTEEGVEDLRAAKSLHNFMVERTRGEVQQLKGARATVASVAGQVGFTWFLGLTPAYWMMNALQSPMVGLPQLGARYGVARSASELMSAAGWFLNVRMGKLIRDSSEPFSIEWLRKQNLKGVSKQELDMLQALEDRQVLDFTQSLDLSRIAGSSTGLWNKAMRYAAAGAHHTEVFNRVSFALAAYRLALKSNPDVRHEQAVRMAEDAVAEAHFDYTSENKPELMRGPYARLIFMFQQYRQHLLYWWAKQVKDAVKGESREVRLRAGKAMGLMASTHLAMAGAAGLPFVGAIGFVADLIAAMFGDDDDEPFDYERWMLDAAKELAGEEGGRILAKGLFDAMGMNIGQRIGQQDLVPFLNWGSARFERDADDKMRAYLFDLLGPMGSIGLGMARGAEAFGRGDTMQGLAQVTPKAIADVFRAIDLHDQGLKNSRGQVLAQREAFDGVDAALQLAGVQPSAVSRIRETRGRIMDAEQHYNERSRVLTRMFVEALLRKDQVGVQEALQDIQRYNGKLAKNQLAEMAITGRRLESAVRDRVQRNMLLALTGGTAETRRQLLLALRAGNMVPQPGSDLDLPPLPGLND